MLKFALVFAFASSVIAANSVPFIVGGQPAADGQFPHAVSLQYNKSHFCGGSVINSTWILTAGHCAAPFRNNPQAIEVLVGTNSLSSGGTRYNVNRSIIHPLYTATPIVIKNDIAVLQLSTAIQSADVHAISVCHKSPSPDDDAQVSGWGVTQGGASTVPDRLQFLNVTIVSFTKCFIQNFPILTLYKQICAVAQRSRGVCNGDSGSALVYQNSQIGIVSWAKGCATGRPDVYANVCDYKDWIEKNAK